MIFGDLVIGKLICRGSSRRDKSSVRKTNAFIEYIQNVIPDQTFLSKYLLVHQLVHYTKSLYMKHYAIIQPLCIEALY